MNRRADAVQDVIADDLLQQIRRHERNHWPGAPAFFFQGQFEDVGLLLCNVLVEQPLVLLEVADPQGYAITVAARIRDEVAGGKDARREYSAGALVCAQRQDVLCAVSDVDHRGDSCVEKACKSLDALLAIGRTRWRIRLGARVEPAAQMDMHVHQPGNQIFPLALDAMTLETSRKDAGRDARDALALDRNSHVTLRCVRAIYQCHVLDDHSVCVRRRGRQHEDQCAACKTEFLHLDSPVRLDGCRWQCQLLNEPNRRTSAISGAPPHCEAWSRMLWGLATEARTGRPQGPQSGAQYARSKDGFWRVRAWPIH